MKPFQVDVTKWALRRGRAALFEGTGLGKTLQELSWARAVHERAGGRVLLFAPLAVAEQTVLEAVKFGIEGVDYGADQAEAKSPIVVTNYDRAHLFELSEFSGVILDESSILKAQDGKTRAFLTEACAGIPYQLCATAMPAPNDWTEIGQHSEFLGVMLAKEMLSMFFVHDGSNRAGGGDGWRLKRHAEPDFWRWVASWAVMIRSPRDLGYEEPGYDLPLLVKRQVTVPVPYEASGETLFPMAASTLSERIAARRQSLEPRVRAAAEIVNAAPDRPWMVWCNLNDEADALVRAIPGAIQVAGSDRREDKAKHLLGFTRGEPRVLVSKPSIAGWGLNYQHCADMVFVGLNDSFEQLYQAVRRCWRFGQTKPVTVHMIASELEGAVVANLEAKEREFEAMADAMAEHMRDLTRAVVRGGRVSASAQVANQPLKLPEWLAAA
ncbi:MAG: hypothetical protein JOZ27_07180 [Caulobacteraceae bacterium]|nr:hypothetical protein [Caulobacteraceae bacterium]